MFFALKSATALESRWFEKIENLFALVLLLSAVSGRDAGRDGALDVKEKRFMESSMLDLPPEELL